MSASEDENVPSEPKRRRIADAEDSDNDNDNENTMDSRVARLEHRAAERRRQRQSQSEREPQSPVLYEGGETTAVDDNDNNNGDDVDVDDALDNDNDLDFNGDNNEDDVEEEEQDGEDLLDNAERDYQRIEALDTYGTEGLDDRNFDNMNIDERRSAEQELSRRDREERRGRGGRNEGLYGMALDVMETQEDLDARRARRGIFSTRDDPDQDQQDDPDDQDQGDQDEDDLDADDQVNLEAFDVPLREWIAQERTRREVQRKFRLFLRNFVQDTPTPDHPNKKRTLLYELKIKQMCAANQQTLQVSYLHLMEAEPVLAFWVADAPRDMLDVLNEAATRHTLSLFPSYNAIKTDIHVRISEVPILDSLRDLRRSHLDSLVKVHGVVTRRSQVYPQLQLAHYTCNNCKGTQGPFRVDGHGTGAAQTYMPDSCPFCEIDGGALFKLHPTLSQYRNFQRCNLQETPGSVPPGRVPRTKEIIWTDDLIDIARPGEEVEITGVYEHTYDSNLTLKSGFPVFSTFITANHVSKRHDDASTNNLSEQDVQQILQLSKDPQIGQRIVQSMAPSIFGHDHCKMALAMSLFGAVPKNIENKHRIRGDVNVLLLGDPGTAKSQLLKYAEHTAPRAVYSTGKGASAVGLTASVHKDPITKEWTLEGGALVLADRGVCLIDEFDKMNEQDRTSIHEAMEQQSISVSKAGIVTSLQARCAVIAAANPIGGRYDSSNTLAENVELTDPILQRFDVLCVLQDVVDPIADERLAKFVTASHMRSTPTSQLARGGSNNSGAETSNSLNDDAKATDNKASAIPQDMLRKYIQYARTNVRPILRNNTFDQEKVASLYVALRKESSASGGVPIAVRHVESIMRMSEAHAKMHLRDYVRDDDMDASIRMMLTSFISAQKFSVRRTLTKSFAKFISSGEDRAHLLLHILQEMFRNEQMYQVIRQRQRGGETDPDGIDAPEVPLDELQSRARDRRIYDISEFCQSEAFQDAGYVLDQERKIITRAL